MGKSVASGMRSACLASRETEESRAKRAALELKEQPQLLEQKGCQTRNGRRESERFKRGAW